MNKSLLNKINPKFLLVTSRALAALRPALIAFLVANGTRLSGGIETPISFCNVLFVGNLCAAIFVGFWFGFKDIIEDLKTLNARIILGLFINGCLASLLSALIFIGLGFTTVINAVLLGTLGPVFFALSGTILLRKKITSSQWFGFSLIIVGVLTIVLKSNMYQINQGDLLIIASAVVYAISALIGKLFLAKDCSLKVVVFSRNLVSSVIFFIIATILFGPNHFGEVFSGQLWIIMSIYALIVIVFAQFLWYAALNKLDSQTVGRWTVLSPIFGVLYAFILNGERPSSLRITAFAVIAVGVFISSLGKKQPQEKETEMDKNPQMECTASAS
jgi:drug/metabolite transporter (DMT)-like permease